MKKRYWIILVALCGLDYLTKYIATSRIEYRDIVSVIDGLFYFTFVKNTGAAWSFLDHQPWIFLVLATLASVAITFYLIKNAKTMNTLVTLSFVFILAGTVGNLIDRLQFGYVRDFIGVYIGNYAFPIFNLADSFLVLGVVGYFIHVMVEDRKLKQGSMR